MKNILEHFDQLNIAVIGDVMLDIFTYGASERLSPEAPVPIIRIYKKNYCAGGAGNVAENLAALDIKCSLFGVCGKDIEGEKLIENIKSKNINAFILKDDSRMTTVKERFIAGHQQMLRVDKESTAPVSRHIQEQFAYKLHNMIENHEIDALIFSDYKKGMLSTDFVQKLITHANNCGVISALDPKPGSLDVIRKLTILKPNRAEAFFMAGMKDDPFADKKRRDELLLQAAGKIYEKYTPKYLVISLSADGLAIYENGKLNIIPTAAKEVYDVSGAGDTLMACMTASLAAGGMIIDAAAIGNIASGIAVGKSGTSCVCRQEISKLL